MKIVFLYTELASYVLSCLKALSQLNCEIQVFHWPVNPEAPFRLVQNSGFQLANRSGLSNKTLLQRIVKIDPDVIVVSGWMDQGYLTVAREFRNKIPVVLSLDNHWTGSLKQRIASLMSPLIIQRKFTHAWVPGEPQLPFARKLGFAPEKIQTGSYCADVTKFQSINTLVPKKNKFLYVGRYLRFKGIFELWNAFQQFQKEHDGWELHCVGTGEEFPNRVKHAGIIHHGFKQPDELIEHLADSAAFIMPSHREPWGVALHEMAVAGLPLIVSDAVGAATRFLLNHQNGYLVEKRSTESLHQAMKTFAMLSDDEKETMGKKSAELGNALTPNDWAQTALSFCPAR